MIGTSKREANGHDSTEHRMPQVKTSLARHTPAVKEVHILWITAGLELRRRLGLHHRRQPAQHRRHRDGQHPRPAQGPSAQPGAAYEVGDEFMKYLYDAAEGRLDPFVLVLEGSIPNETIKEEGYWAALGTDKKTGQPITTCEWIDRLAPKAWAVVAAGTCATYGGIHAMEGNPTGCMGLADYLGWDFKIERPACRSSTFRAARSSPTT